MNSSAQPGGSNLRHLAFFGMVGLAAASVYRPLATVLERSFSVDQYSQVLMVVPISAVLVFLEHRRIFARVNYSIPSGAVYLLAVAMAVFVGRTSAAMEHSNHISLSILIFAVAVISAFACCYGISATRAGAFPLGFLIFMAPMPDWMLDHTIYFLQHGSAVLTDWFFSIAGVRFFREGFVISLPEVTIEVAKECSGIRSSLVLVLSGLVLGHLFLRSPWSKLALAIAIIPMTIVKNGVRIFTLTLLGTKVDSSFLTGRLHHQGGIVFFALAFVLIWIMVWILQRIETRTMPEPLK